MLRSIFFVGISLFLLTNCTRVSMEERISLRAAQYLEDEMMKSRNQCRAALLSFDRVRLVSEQVGGDASSSIEENRLAATDQQSRIVIAPVHEFSNQVRAHASQVGATEIGVFEHFVMYDDASYTLRIVRFRSQTEVIDVPQPTIMFDPNGRECGLWFTEYTGSIVPDTFDLSVLPNTPRLLTKRDPVAETWKTTARTYQLIAGMAIANEDQRNQQLRDQINMHRAPIFSKPIVRQ